MANEREALVGPSLSKASLKRRSDLISIYLSPKAASLSLSPFLSSEITYYLVVLLGSTPSVGPRFLEALT